MASERRVVALSEVATFQEGYVNPSQSEPSYFDGDVKWLRAVDLNNGKVRDTSRRLTDKGFRSAGKSATLFRPGTLAISKSGTIGRLGILEDFMCGNRAVINIRPGDAVDSRYVFYSLLLKRGEIEVLAEGSVQKNLYVSALGTLPLELPSLDEQRAIAGFVGDIDDRIDNLHQTNTTIGAIAQSLFKSWFVDFDPVRAKAEEREPEGMDAATAALFPSEFEDSELGPIPKGWRVAASDELFEMVGGGTPKTSVAEYWDGDVPWFSVVDAPANGQVFTLGTAKKITALGLQNCSAKLLPEMTTIVSARGTVGKVALTGVPMAMNQSCYALRPKAKDGESFVYFSTLRFVEQLQRIAHGAVFDTITRDSFKRIMVCVPPDDVIAKFGSFSEVLMRRIQANGRQAISLVSLRDTLLPRLISGKLRLPAAAEEVAMA